MPLAVAHALGQSPAGVARLEVARGEQHGVLRGEVEGDRAEARALIVDGLELHRARLVRVVDDAHEPRRLAARRQHQRQGV